MAPRSVRAVWFDPQVSFTVEVLVDDGVVIEPFNAHPEMSGALRAIGFGVHEWRAWLEAVVADARVNRSPPGGVRRNPVDHWMGSPNPVPRLNDRWTRYESRGEALSTTFSARLLEWPSDRYTTRTPDALQGRHIELVMVQYVSMVVLPLASDSFVVGDDITLFDKRRLESILGVVDRAV